MPTSHKTREYWIDKAKGWAENCLTHPDYGGSPQLDEFNAVMDELLALSDRHEVTMVVKLNSDDVKQIDKTIEAEFNKILWPELREIVAVIPPPVLQAVRDVLATTPDESFPDGAMDIIVASMRDGKIALQWYEKAKKYEDVLKWYGDAKHYDKNGALYGRKYLDFGRYARKILEEK